ncbi:methyltransferase, FkbM family [Daejeonella rubra]|uniref:Methyltransferase, FkbM family n=1 Tax=Daejeonella rubra TaxID=990371 RepID=A0A1G9WUM3_9SPHI|nr:FkbM family methyltransferase [Daejeonella rubra]SDM88294.1 methyltransferase, FkbM family [Daejeonella rubra]
MENIKTIKDNFKIYAQNPLEEYRADSFFTKEPETVAWIDSFNSDDIFFDIGANVGIYSLYATIRHSCKTYSFEPYHKNYFRLLDNISLNNVQDICLPFLCGLYSQTKIDTFYVSDDRTSSSGHQVGTDVDEHGNKFIALQKYPLFVFALDDFIKLYNIPFPNHIKIDVDGVEDEIIKGMQEILANPSLKSVSIEINNGSGDRIDVKDIFKNFGFSTDNSFNVHPNHSRFRRAQNKSSVCENIVFSKK